MDEPNPIGPQYDHDDPFREQARFHQSKFRADVLKVPYKDYGNRLQDEDGRKLVAYYDGLGVREAKRARYPKYSATRDGDLLRSEHIPFNLFGPLIRRSELAEQVLRRGLRLDCQSVSRVEIEWPPRTENYLGDSTSFDTIVWFEDPAGRRCAAGIEVKYTEGPYAMLQRERDRVNKMDSTYWTTTRSSGAFLDPASPALMKNSVRQFWRNHLLGLAMVLNGDVDVFHSLIVYPAGNSHCAKAVPLYRSLLTEEARERVRGVTFEEYIGGLEGEGEVGRWRGYLERRYLVPAE